MRPQILFVLISALLFLPAFPAFGETSAECVVFSRNLRLGMEGSDVKVLQRLLNKNPVTKAKSRRFSRSICEVSAAVSTLARGPRCRRPAGPLGTRADAATLLATAK